MALELCKYYKKQRYVSYNDGLTWQPLEEYEKGELYESHSSSCGAGVFQYRWVLINNGYICDGKDRYTREVYQYSEDGTVWYNVWPTTYRKSTLVETDSSFCDNAGNGQYIDEGTDPSSGDTYFCPPDYHWDGRECVCDGVMVDGDCIVCKGGLVWNGSSCTCPDGYYWRNTWNGGYCAKIQYNPNDPRPDPYNGWAGRQDPYKAIKCDNVNGVLTSADTAYFSNGWSLLSYEVGDCIYRIDNNAFNGHQFMTSITISDTVVEIGNLAFANCKSLSSITIPSSSVTYGNNVFDGCENLETLSLEANSISAITNFMFANCVKLQAPTWLLHNSVVSIEAGAFSNCYALNNIELPNSLEYIGIKSFYHCNSLQNISIPSGVTVIGEGAFSNCSAMTFVNINSNNVTINNNAFADCSSLTAATIESSAITMGNNVFDGCTRLLKLTFTSPTPFAIEEHDFDDTNECKLIVPCESEQAYKTAWPQYADRITCTDDGIYYRWIDTDGIYCDGYDEYTKQKQQSTTNGISWTDTGAYRGKDLITHYSENCGYSYEVLLTVTHSDGITRYYVPCDSEPPKPSENSKIFATYIYGNNSEILCDGSTTLTSGETMMGGSNYSYRTMETAVVGNCVTTISKGAFYAFIELRTVTIGSGVTSIGNNAFYACRSLSSIIVNTVTPPSIGSDVFYQTNNCQIYVPAESVNTYKSASGWSNYASRIQAIPNS